MKDNIGVEAISLAKYVEPSYEETVSKQGWVERGDDNLFPQYLIDLYNSSAVHRGIVDSIAKMTYGAGFKSGIHGQLKIDKLGLGNAYKKAAADLKLQGGFYLQLKMGIGGDGISSVEHVPFEYIRSGVMDEDGNVGTFYHCIDWEDHRRAGVTEIPAFNAESKEPVQLMYVKMYSIGSMYYPTPDYMGAINWIEVDKEISIFHNSNLQNGMSPSFAIHWKNGVPNAQERQAVRMQVERQLTGTGNTGKFWMTFSDNPDQVPEIIPFELSDAASQYEWLSNHTTDKIIQGHGVTSPSLVGVKTAGQLSGASEIEEAAKLFYYNIISYYQDILLESVESILSACGIMEEVSIVQSNPLFVETPATAEKSYTGIQISSAVDIVSKVKTGELESSQATQLLISLLGFDEEAANKMFEDVEIKPVVMSSEELTDSEGEKWLDYLEKVGEKVSDDWVLVAEDEVTDPENEDLYFEEIAEEGKKENTVYNKAVRYFQRFANPDEKSEIDTGLYKIRYRYSDNVSDKSRIFCKNMVANSKNGVVYRYEDIKNMEGVNAEFAPKGKSSYSIWLYKGGAYCHHHWVRQVYVRKRDRGKFLPNKGLENDKEVSEANAQSKGVPFKDRRKRWKTASTAPIDTPSKGKLN